MLQPLDFQPSFKGNSGTDTFSSDSLDGSLSFETAYIEAESAEASNDLDSSAIPVFAKTEVRSLELEKRVFANMRSSGLGLMLQLVDDVDHIDTLKTLIAAVDEELKKYHAAETHPASLSDLDVMGAIDALETVHYLGELRQIHLKKHRLKRRLAEWGPPAYLVVNTLNDMLRRIMPDNVQPLTRTRLQKNIHLYFQQRNRMAQANMRLVYSVANRFRHIGLPFEDLVQEGHLGLLKAIERFDITKGFRFSTYAHIVISQSIHLALDKQVGMVRLPFKALREKASVEKVRQSLEQSLGRPPHINELNQHLSDQLEYKATHIANLVEPNANSYLLYAMPEDTEQLAAFSVQEQEHKQADLKNADQVEQMLQRLDARESYIVRMRYGIGLGKEFTLEEISHAMGLSRERVRQLANQAVAKLGRIYG